MKSAKRIFAIILAVMLLSIVASVPALAVAPAGYGRTDRCNDFREQAAELIAQTANETIERLVAQAQSSRHPNIARLVRQTNAISASAIAFINMLGVEAECVYETYIIGGVAVEIDPIIIIKRG